MAVFDQGKKIDAIASQRQRLVKVAGWDGYFATSEGGEVSAEGTKAWDGGQLTPEVLSTPAETDNITVSRPYRPALHAEKLREWKKRVGRLRTTLSIADTDEDLDAGVLDSVETYPAALLVRVKPPQSDASSSDANTFELEFAVAGGE